MVDCCDTIYVLNLCLRSVSRRGGQRAFRSNAKRTEKGASTTSLSPAAAATKISCATQPGSYPFAVVSSILPYREPSAVSALRDKLVLTYPVEWFRGLTYFCCVVCSV